MRIGIDIDGVLTNMANWQVDYGTKYCYTKNNGKLIKIDEYTSKKMFGWNENLDEKFWEEHIFDYAKNEPMRPFANEIIKKLKNEGHEIYIITARTYTTEDSKNGRKMRKCVRKWLKKNKIPYTQIIYSGHNKVYACETLNIDIMIDDYSKNLEMLKDTVKHLICYDDRYNEDLKLPNLIRGYSWYDIYDKIKNIEQKSIKVG